MTSILKVDNIKDSANNQAISISSGNLTIPGSTTFTGTVTGAGMDLLLNSTISSTVAQFDISSTYINSTYDDYFCTFKFTSDADDRRLEFRVFSGGVIQTGNIYGVEIAAMSSSTYENNNGTDNGRLNVTGIGNGSGEGITGHFYMHNINNTDLPFTMMGQSTQYNTSALPNANHFSAQVIPANASTVVNGIRLYFNGSNNMTSGNVKLYGLRK